MFVKPNLDEAVAKAVAAAFGNPAVKAQCAEVFAKSLKVLVIASEEFIAATEAELRRRKTGDDKKCRRGSTASA